MSQHLPHRNPLPQLIPARVRHVRASVEAQIWQRQQPLNVSCSAEQFDPIDCVQAASLAMRPLAPGDHFGRGGDQWSWFWLRIDVPAANADEVGQRYLRWQCQGETTVWFDGRPWAGLDIAHRECPLPDRACTLWLECCSWQTGIWISMADAEAIGRTACVLTEPNWPDETLSLGPATATWMRSCRQWNRHCVRNQI